MLTPEDARRRDEWLRRLKTRRFKHMTYCGFEITIADAERWLRDALDSDKGDYISVSPRQSP